MKNLLSNVSVWRERLQRRPLAVFLDYDGTLSPIAPTPAQAKLSYTMQKTLKALVALKNVKVAIVSGRGLSELKRMVPVEGLSYVGSHGMEFQSGAAISKDASAVYLRQLRGLKKELAGQLGGLSGILFEQKPFSLAIHYRKASLRSEKVVKRAVFGICNDPVDRGRIMLITGKKVIEIMPPKTMDKGQALKRLLHAWGRKNPFPVFIGDDKTDEAAFAVLRGKGLTVRVGRPKAGSKAEYYVNDVSGVRAFLEMIIFFRASY